MSTTRPTIRVQGHGRVASEPDIVVLSLVIVAGNREYAKTIHEVNTRTTALREAIIKAGEDPKALKITAFDVTTDTEYVDGRRVFCGFQGTHSLELRTGFDHKRLSRLFSAITASSAKARLSLSFTVSDPEGLRQRVIAAAVANAQQRAKVICEAAGQQLGGMVSIEYGYAEIRVSSDVFSLGAEIQADTAPEMEPAEVESSDTVTMVWEIE